MNFQFTARHFKTSPTVPEFAESAVRSLLHLYDGIVAADVTVEDGDGGGDSKMAEISIHVYREKLFARESSDDLVRSIQGCVDKLERQLKRYKDKLHAGRRPHGRPGSVESIEE